MNKRRTSFSSAWCNQLSAFFCSSYVRILASCLCVLSLRFSFFQFWRFSSFLSSSTTVDSHEDLRNNKNILTSELNSRESVFLWFFCLSLFCYVSKEPDCVNKEWKISFYFFRRSTRRADEEEQRWWWRWRRSKIMICVASCTRTLNTGDDHVKK